MSSRLFQTMVLQMKDSVNKTVGVIDANGYVIACSDLKQIGQQREDVAYDIAGTGETIVYENMTYKSLTLRSTHFEYAVFVEGSDELSKNLCQLAAVSLGNVKQFHDEKYDKATFIKNVMLDNILSGDIYIKAKELHFEGDVPRVIFLVRNAHKNDAAVSDVLMSLFPEKQKDFVIPVNENDIAVVKQVRPNSEAKELRKIAKSIEDTLNSELLIKTTIGISTICFQLIELAQAYKESQVAIEVGLVFGIDNTIINYENLGIGRLIYKLPTTLCRIFLSEVFKKGTVDMLDQETLQTIQTFFENNLNVSEASRKLFVHRNTLVYRLEKIKKLTGLDLREFDNAIVFKVALMVKQYLAACEQQQR
ncbi:MAG: helix-turn-helix domain-containing protein [Clostridia bacterium]|nr:helix-turn-helix domain-containing protein [Clostridia bacterium]